jgi:hypothetical protein
MQAKNSRKTIPKPKHSPMTPAPKIIAQNPLFINALISNTYNIQPFETIKKNTLITIKKRFKIVQNHSKLKKITPNLKKTVPKSCQNRPMPTPKKEPQVTPMSISNACLQRLLPSPTQSRLGTRKAKRWCVSLATALRKDALGFGDPGACETPPVPPGYFSKKATTPSVIANEVKQSRMHNCL